MTEDAPTAPPPRRTRRALLLVAVVLVPVLVAVAAWAITEKVRSDAQAVPNACTLLAPAIASDSGWSPPRDETHLGPADPATISTCATDQGDEGLSVTVTRGTLDAFRKSFASDAVVIDTTEAGHPTVQATRSVACIDAIQVSPDVNVQVGILGGTESDPCTELGEYAGQVGAALPR